MARQGCSVDGSGSIIFQRAPRNCIKKLMHIVPRTILNEVNAIFIVTTKITVVDSNIVCKKAVGPTNCLIITILYMGPIYDLSL